MSGRDGAWKMSDGSVMRRSWEVPVEELLDGIVVASVSPSILAPRGHRVKGRWTNAGSMGATSVDDDD